MDNLFYSKIGLFVPCYMDIFKAEAAIKSLKLLERFNLNVKFIYNSICCGQPFFNSGQYIEGIKIANQFIEESTNFDFIIILSGSCTSTVRNHYEKFISDKKLEILKTKVYEFTEFLHDVLKLQKSNHKFAKKEKVGLLHSCHGLRELHLGVSEELNLPSYSKLKTLVEKIEGVEIVDIPMWDECCGFGGSFSFYENSLSVKMGLDKLKNYHDKDIHTVIGYDVSCLMHLNSLSYKSKQPIQFYYIAEFLYDAIALGEIPHEA